VSWVAQLEDVRRGREAPSFVISGTYVVARRRHGPMMLTLGLIPPRPFLVAFLGPIAYGLCARLVLVG